MTTAVNETVGRAPGAVAAGRYPVSKRLFDLALSLAALLVLWPLLLALAIWVRLDTPGPVLYRGTRAGLGGRPFKMNKFRSMVVNADKGASSTPSDDPRITRAGAVLRRFKLDELPQLLNVVKGEMSFVGPRPQVIWEVERYTAEERGLLALPPGITDWASLKYRNEGEILKGAADPDAAYHELIAPGKTRLGLEYVRTRTLLTDVKIIAATALSVLGVDPAWCIPAHERNT
jgi:lipopolysaccharide/colanic/teichoic acid biosynthesis glycosyltransferase